MDWLISDPLSVVWVWVGWVPAWKAGRKVAGGKFAEGERGPRSRAPSVLPAPRQGRMEAVWPRGVSARPARAREAFTTPLSGGGA